MHQQKDSLDYSKDNVMRIFIVKKPLPTKKAQSRNSIMDYPLRITNYNQYKSLPKVRSIHHTNHHRTVKSKQSFDFTHKAKNRLRSCLRIVNSKGKESNCRLRDACRKYKNTYFGHRIRSKEILVKRFKSQVYDSYKLYEKNIKKQYIYALRSTNAFPHFNIEDVKRRIEGTMKRNSSSMICCSYSILMK